MDLTVAIAAGAVVTATTAIVAPPVAGFFVPYAMSAFGTVVSGVGTIHAAGGVAATLQVISASGITATWTAVSASIGAAAVYVASIFM